MNNAFGIAWRQLTFQKIKLAAAAAGVVVAVMLMLVQLGIRTGAMENSIAFARRIKADLILVGPRTDTIFRSAQFPRRLLYRLPADPTVEQVDEIYLGKGIWRNPWTHLDVPISLYGIDPENQMVELPGYADLADQLRLADRHVFDSLGRTTFGPVVETFAKEGEFPAEVNNRQVHIAALLPVGVSIENDGSLYSTRANFLRLNPGRSPGAIDLGLVQLRTGTDVDAAKVRLQRLLGEEARVMTNQEMIASEIRFMRETAPIDFIFGMGTIVGFFIGCVVVYQILYTEVTNNLPKLATMKAMGFDNRFLSKLVISQAMILAAIGYVPGFFMAIGLYRVAESQIQMPFSMTLSRAVGVLLATTVMCGASALIAVRKAWNADPAEVF